MTINSNLNIGMTIYVLEHLLQQIEAALHAGQDGVGDFAGFVFLQLLLYVSQYQAYHLNDGDYKGSKGKRPSVETERK